MKTISKKSNTLEILNKYHLKASKKFGQNFLVEPNIIHKIGEIAAITKDTLVIEIGPGIGALTQELSMRAGKVIAFEIDTRLQEVLADTLHECDNVEIIFQDFLKCDLESLLKETTYQDVCVVTNLPYYITSDIITKVVQLQTPISRMIAMVQKEVALKLTSDEKSPLKFIIEYIGDIHYEMTVSKNVFLPAPHVDSAVIKIDKNRNIDTVLVEVINQAFKAKRKTILNNMKTLFDNPQEVLKKCGVDPQKRAQELTIEDFVKLAEEKKL